MNQHKVTIERYTVGYIILGIKSKIWYFALRENSVQEAWYPVGWSGFIVTKVSTPPSIGLWTSGASSEMLFFFPFCKLAKAVTANRAGQRSTHKAWETRGQSTLSRLLLITSQNALWGNGQKEYKVVQLSGSPPVDQDDLQSESAHFIKPRNNDISLVTLNLPIHLPVSYFTAHSSASNHSFYCCQRFLKQIKEIQALIFQPWAELSVKMFFSFTKSSEPFMYSSRLSCRPRSQPSQSADRERLSITSTEYDGYLEYTNGS